MNAPLPSSYKRYHVSFPVIVTEAHHGGGDVVPAEVQQGECALDVRIVIAAASAEHAAQIVQERIDGAIGDP